ncbi:MAG TPA: SpoIVB peptidase S55 domain-containing protein [Patescibacteria group bacterium]|nr:SpoIVB peptidase S55 domain-containing protein [Patescibacteria group bacterium]
MKRSILLIVSLGLSCCLLATDIMKLSEIKTGMEGEGKTIFKGSNIESFKFKVLGILDKFVSDKNLIIAELFAPELNEGGVIAGMSGSPVYIDGKLIGSVSYGLSNFSKKPIAGITPIEDILKISAYSGPVANVEISDIKIDFSKKNVKRVAEAIQNELVSRMNFSPARNLTPIKLFASSSGFCPEAVHVLQGIFVPLQNLGIGAEVDKKKLSAEMFTVRPADAVSIPLIRGDASYAATGTVTHVDGKKVYVFGHPFFNLGTVEFPLHRAEVISVVPSYESSFKLATTRNMVGTVQQDRFSGVLAELGKTPYMIPLKIFLKNRNRNFNLEVVNHPLLTPTLTYISLLNALLVEFQEFGFQSISVTGKIFIENEENVVLNDLFSGTTAFDEFSTLVMAINYFLLNNQEKSIKIQKMDFEISGRETIKKAQLENVLINENSYLPGELMDIRMKLKNEKGDSFEEQIIIKAPNLKPGSVFYLLVADAGAVTDFDTKAIKTVYFPTKLGALIRAINNIRRNNRIYLKIFVPAQGVFIKGFEYSYLPSSLRNVLLFNSLGNDQANMALSTIAEYQYEVPAVVSGKKIFKLIIKERKNE